jgi:hypothetical protein
MNLTAFSAVFPSALFPFTPALSELHAATIRKQIIITVNIRIAHSPFFPEGSPVLPQFVHEQFRGPAALINYWSGFLSTDKVTFMNQLSKVKHFFAIDFCPLPAGLYQSNI